MPTGYSLGGIVKSWNGLKGYGFITCENFEGDIMFSKNELPQDAREVQGTFLQGRPVAFEATEGPDGRAKATSVAILAVEGHPVAGAIKSYSDKNGYGFLTSTSLTEDVRFQRADLPPMLAGMNLAGLLVTFLVQARPDGKLMAKNIKLQSGQVAKGGTAVGIPMPQMAVLAQLGMLPLHMAPVVTHHGGATVGMNQLMAQLGMQQVQMGQTAQMSPVGEMNGTVKSFSEKNGYGFITVPGQAGDIKFGKNDLQPGMAVQVGVRVRFSALVGPDGRMQAKQVTPDFSWGGASNGGVKRSAQVSAGFSGVLPGFRGGGLIQPLKKAKVVVTETEEVGSGQWAAGTVKSFNASKGFGFIQSPDVASDLFFMRSNLPQEVQQEGVSQGQGVSFEVVVAGDGKLRAQNITLDG